MRARLRDDASARQALWWLDRFGPAGESLSGDLIEEFQSGRSRLWLWRQTVTALAVETGRTARAHPVMILRGLCVGWLTVQLTYLLGRRLLTRTLGDWLLDRFIVWFGSAEFPMMWATHLRFWPAMCLANLFAGWLVVRLHRPYAGPVLLSCTIALSLQSTYAGIAYWTRPRHQYYEMPYPMLSVVSFILPTVILLIGGLLSSRRGTKLISAS